MKLTEEERHYINELRKIKHGEVLEFIEGELVVVSDSKDPYSGTGIYLFEDYNLSDSNLRYKAYGLAWRYCERLPKIPVHFKFVKYNKPDDVDDNDLVVVKFRHGMTGKIFYDTDIANKINWMSAIGYQIIEDLEK